MASSNARKELVSDIDVVRNSLQTALTYPSKEKLGEEAYREAHKNLSEALYSLSRIERFCSRIDLDYLTP